MTRLREDPEALPWAERKAVAQEVAAILASDEPTETILGLVYQLAEDRKAEVRKKIADSLVHLTEDDFRTLAASLSRDSNSLVRRAVERARERRRRGQWSETRRRRRLDQVADGLREMERRYGPDAADRATRLAERLYHILIGSTVHDMKGILTPLKSGVDALLAHVAAGSLEPRTLSKLLARVQGRVATMEHLLDDMHHYAQASPPVRRRERFLEIVIQAQAMVAENFASQGRAAPGISVTLDVPESISLEVSRHQIALAVANVLQNAYEAFATSPDSFLPGRIETRAKVEGGSVVLTVKDSGMGLSKEELEDVQRFIPGGTSKKRHGTGFGLPIARRKIIDYGGELEIRSEENQETTVTITLPLEGRP